ncbi:hypothetical protein CW707_02455 [Candidatus Bathyarchaeota archaeon]|nr:MAG: hypothetical protein CW707_02455 [Candidatus Bathyarchaeota archaeon]
MGERLKVFALVALLGFMAGVIADLTAEYIIPTLMTILPAFFSVAIRFVRPCRCLSNSSLGKHLGVYHWTQRSIKTSTTLPLSTYCKILG